MRAIDLGGRKLPQIFLTIDPTMNRPSDDPTTRKSSNHHTQCDTVELDSSISNVQPSTKVGEVICLIELSRGYMQYLFDELIIKM